MKKSSGDSLADGLMQEFQLSSRQKYLFLPLPVIFSGEPDQTPPEYFAALFFFVSGCDHTLQIFPPLFFRKFLYGVAQHGAGHPPIMCLEEFFFRG